MLSGKFATLGIGLGLLVACGDEGVLIGGRQSPASDAAMPSTNPSLTLQTSPTEIVVRSPGSFELAFAADQHWQPARFLDLETTGNANLAQRTPDQPNQTKFQVLASPIGIRTGTEWLTLNEASMGSASAELLGPDEVLVTTEYRMSGTVAIWNIQAEYRVHRAGRLAATVTATTPISTNVDGIEFGYTSVDTTYDWTSSVAADGQSFSLRANNGPLPRPALSVRAVAPTVATRVSSDTVGSRYFHGGGATSISTASPLVVTWELDF